MSQKFVLTIMIFIENGLELEKGWLRGVPIRKLVLKNSLKNNN